MQMSISAAVFHGAGNGLGAGSGPVLVAMLEHGIIPGSIPGVPAQAILEVMPDNHLRWLKLGNRESA